MHWKKSKSREYLFRSRDRFGYGKSLGPRSPETEKILTAIQKNELKYTPISTFPTVRRDLSIVVPPKTLSSDLIKTAHRASQLLTKCLFFDEFTDKEKLGELKNLSFHLAFRSWDKTLTESEIDTAFGNITKLLHEKFGAELRLEFDKNR